MVAYRVALVLASSLASLLGSIRLATSTAVLLVLSFVLFPASAWAFLDPPYITPANPVAGEMISVNIYGGECDLADTGFVWPPPVMQEGNKISILLTGSHHGDPEWCYFSIGTEIYPVGMYPAGPYVLDVERQYFNFAGVLVRETLGIIPFTVTAPAPAQTEAAPTLGIVGVYVLLLALMAVAARHLRSKRLKRR
jgi:hypothetical protein